MKSKKLQALINTYEDLSNKFREIDEPTLNLFSKGWSISLTQIDKVLSDSDNKVTLSQLSAGFEQGLRETALMLAELPTEVRTLAIREFNQVVALHIPNFFEKTKKQLEKVVSKGVIKTEQQWYLVRTRMDEIEGKNGCDAEFEYLDKLLMDFESNV